MFGKICSNLGINSTNLTALADSLCKAANEKISVPLRELLLDASTLLGSVRQAILLENVGEDEPFVLQQLRDGREDIRQLAIALECAVCYSALSQELNQLLRTSAHKLFYVQEALCRNCGGTGTLRAGPDSDLQACPECQSDGYGASQRSSAVALMQATSALSAAIALAAEHGADTRQLVARQTELLDALNSVPSAGMLPVRRGRSSC
jgi:hypothetical protein